MTTTQTERLMALADRYAFHIPGSQHSDEARAVLLAALQEQAREGEVEQEPIARIMFNDDGRKTDNLIDCDLPVGTLLYAAPQPAREGESVKFLANGKRFKLSSAGGPVAVFLGFPPELAGRWVALVAAEDDCHLKLAAPQPAQPEQGHST